MLRPRRRAFGCLASGLHAYDTDTTTVTEGWEGGQGGAPDAPPSSLNDRLLQERAHERELNPDLEAHPKLETW